MPTTTTSSSTSTNIAAAPRKFASPAPLPPPLVADVGGRPQMPRGVRGAERGDNGLAGIMGQKDVEAMGRLGDRRPAGFM
jgi:hypothetical protein